MLEPVGPLPAAVYWRRRAAALAGTITLVGLVLATAGPPAAAPTTPATPVAAANRQPAPEPVASSGEPAPADLGSPDAAFAAAEGGRDTPATTSPVTTSPVTTPATTPPATTSAAATPVSTPSSTTPPTSAPPTSTAAAAPGAAASAPGTERIRPDDTHRLSIVTQAAVPASGPAPCANAMLSAEAELDHAVHRVGSHPVLRLVITNVSGQPCVRDLDAARQEIVVWSADGRNRLWSSNDCGNASTIDLRTLVPGRPVAFAVTWGERTSVPGCRAPRTAVPAGTYRLMVRLDNLISPPTPFIRTP